MYILHANIKLLILKIQINRFTEYTLPKLNKFKLGKYDIIKRKGNLKSKPLSTYNEFNRNNIFDQVISESDQV